MSLGLLKVLTTKRWHTKLCKTGEFKRDNLQRTGIGSEKTSRDRKGRELPEPQARAIWRGTLPNSHPIQSNLVGNELGE